jgi:hypothetical protein
MNWGAYVDNYCERLAPGFWGEPLNALSNAAFVLAAVVVWRWWPRQPLQERWDVNALLLSLGLIGVCSFLFHTFATRWAAAVDVLSIALYLLLYLAVYAHRGLGLHWRWAWLGAPAFVAIAWVFSQFWVYVASGLRSIELNNGVHLYAGFAASLAHSGYLSAWTVLLVVIGHSAGKCREMLWPLTAAAVVFLASLTLRQLDLPLCSQFPWGTHFAWHLLNAVTLGLTAWAMVRRVIATGRT